jgi:ABC-2 type transport system permease protein
MAGFNFPISLTTLQRMFPLGSVFLTGCALIYALAGRPIPTPIAGDEYPGYPLLANGSAALAWFLGGLPLLIVIGWWWSRWPPQIAAQLIKNGGQP